MRARLNSRAALVLFSTEERQVLIDLKPVESDICQVVEFGTSIVLNNGDHIIWNNPEQPSDSVILIDYRPQASNIHSVIKGSSGEIERYDLNYSNKGIVGVFYLRHQPQRHPVFTQRWRFTYALHKRRVVVSSHQELGIEVRTY